MNKDIKNIIEVNTKQQINKSIVKQGDAVCLDFKFIKDSRALDLQEASIIINIVKPDNTLIVQSEGIVINQNRLVAKLNQEATKVPGTIKIEISITKAANKISTFTKFIEVEGSITENTEASKNVVTVTDILVAKIVEANTKIAKIEELKKTTEIVELTKLNKAIEGGLQNLIPNTIINEENLKAYKEYGSPKITIDSFGENDNWIKVTKSKPDPNIKLIGVRTSRIRENLYKDKEYTLSFKAKGNEWGRNLNYNFIMDNTEGHTSNQGISSINIVSTEVYNNEVYSIKFTPKIDMLDSDVLIGIKKDVLDDNVIFWIKDIMLVEGEVPAGYVPSIYDMAEKNEVKNVEKKLVDSVTNITNDINQLRTVDTNIQNQVKTNNDTVTAELNKKATKTEVQQIKSNLQVKTLWENTNGVYLSGTELNLSDDISKYQMVIVDYDIYGMARALIDFTFSNICKIPLVNAGDNKDSRVSDVGDIEITKLSGTKLQIRQNVFRTHSPTTVVEYFNSEGSSIKRIVGIKIV